MKNNNKVLSLLGLATKAGKVASGEFSTEKSVKTGKGFLVLVADDASQNTKKKFQNMCDFYEVPIYFIANKEELGRFCGKEFRASLAVQDENFAKATGVRVELSNVLIAVLTAVTIVLGMRMMGAMLISSLIIFPALTSMRIFKSFRGVVICSGVLAVVCFLLGIIFSYGFSTPAGASVVMVNLAAFVLFTIAQNVLMRITKK